jgi:hypothetical protein
MARRIVACSACNVRTWSLNASASFSSPARFSRRMSFAASSLSGPSAIDFLAAAAARTRTRSGDVTCDCIRQCSGECGAGVAFAVTGGALVPSFSSFSSSSEEHHPEEFLDLAVGRTPSPGVSVKLDTFSLSFSSVGGVVGPSGVEDPASSWRTNALIVGVGVLAVLGVLASLAASASTLARSASSSALAYSTSLSSSSISFSLRTCARLADSSACRDRSASTSRAKLSRSAYVCSSFS